MSHIEFTPSLKLDTRQTPGVVEVKGQSPHLPYPIALIQIYPEIPSLDVRAAYDRIREELDRADGVLHRRMNLRPSFRLPEVDEAAEASALLAALFDPLSYSVDSIDLRPTVASGSMINLFRLDIPRPFPLERAGHAKLLHTLAWIDSNIKVNVERIGTASGMPIDAISDLVETALTIYCLLIKMQDFRLARLINFNHSMFLQERILNLVFGDPLFFGSPGVESDALKTGALANHMALELLKGLGVLSYRRLCTLSLFMGVVWTNHPDVQRAFEVSPDESLGALQLKLGEATKQICIDHIDHFLAHIGKDATETVLVILDDNGESVFDLALWQQLLRETGHLKVEFIVNRYPVSNNIALDTLERLLSDDYFAALQHYRARGRVMLCIEEQAFRSFEFAYLSPCALRHIENADLAYIKGANFFETFQPTKLTRYYCFTVNGFTSRLLTGCPEGSGVFARVPAGCEGYLHESPDQVHTLREIVVADLREGEPNADG